MPTLWPPPVSYTHLDVYKRQILEHHERHDGSGYPRGLKGDEISGAGRILLLAELVAALLEKNSREPDKQRSVILRLNHSKFDQAMTTQILKLLEQEHAVADEADLQPEQPQAERLKRLAGECDKWRQLRSQPVSYTHLDVYKRQVLMLLLLLPPTSTPPAPTACAPRPCAIAPEPVNVAW